MLVMFWAVEQLWLSLPQEGWRLQGIYAMPFRDTPLAQDLEGRTYIFTTRKRARDVAREMQAKTNTNGDFARYRATKVAICIKKEQPNANS